jgi:hypothetical protein
VIFIFPRALPRNVFPFKREIPRGKIMRERAAQKAGAVCHRCVWEEKKKQNALSARIETQQVSSSYSFAPAPIESFH